MNAAGKHKIFVALLVLLAVAACAYAAFQVKTDLSTGGITYFVKFKADAELTVIANTTCQNLHDSSPDTKTMEEFAAKNNCTIDPKVTDKRMTCGDGENQDVYMFYNKKGCEEILAKMKELVKDPNFEKEVVESLTAQWYTFDLYTDSDTPSLTSCVESKLTDPQEILKEGICKVNASNEQVQSFKCRKNGKPYTLGFVRGKNMCERVKNEIVKSFKK